MSIGELFFQPLTGEVERDYRTLNGGLPPQKHRKGTPIKVLAQRIRELRIERGMSSEVVARRLDVSHKAVLNWEKERADPSLKNLVALADLFAVRVEYLLGETDDRTRHPKVSGGRGSASPEPSTRDSGDVASARAAGRARRAPRSASAPRPPSA